MHTDFEPIYEYEKSLAGGFNYEFDSSIGLIGGYQKADFAQQDYNMTRPETGQRRRS
jgi:hypothetical protein